MHYPTFEQELDRKSFQGLQSTNTVAQLNIQSSAVFKIAEDSKLFVICFYRNRMLSSSILFQQEVVQRLVEFGFCSSRESFTYHFATQNKVATIGKYGSQLDFKAESIIGINTVS